MTALHPIHRMSEAPGTISRCFASSPAGDDPKGAQTVQSHHAQVLQKPVAPVRCTGLA